MEPRNPESAPANPGAYLEQLTVPQRLRAENKTRRAEIDGRKVKFQRLATNCKVTASWSTFWTRSYRTKDEAAEAAKIWEGRAEIMEYGFTRKA